MYKVIYSFVDPSDGDGHVYLTGDTYPREGFEPTAERILELGSTANGLGFPVIEKAEEPVAETVEEPEQVVEQVTEAEPETVEAEEPVEEQEKPAEPEEKPAAARSGRGRKRANAQ